MAGDHAVRSLLEKMTQSASSAYLGILERYLIKTYIDLNYNKVHFCKFKVSF